MIEKCPEEIDFLTLDEIAECYNISVETYKLLWKLTGEADQAGKGRPLGRRRIWRDDRDPARGWRL